MITISLAVIFTMTPIENCNQMIMITIDPNPGTGSGNVSVSNILNLPSTYLMCRYVMPQTNGNNSEISPILSGFHALAPCPGSL